jgi:hypothetical protein
MRRDFTLTLENNALDSLAHAIEHYGANESPRDMKYVILHVSHAVELFLKARLAMEHPSLIFVKPEDAKVSGARTVDLRTAVLRLGASDILLPTRELDDLKYIKDVRNSIEHYRAEFSAEDAAAYIGRAVRFLERFLEQELKINLEERLDDETYNAFVEAFHVYEERLDLALKAMESCLPAGKDRLEYDILCCDECGEMTVPYPDRSSDDASVHCFFCRARFEYERCNRCGAPSVIDEGSGGICDDCWTQIASSD